MRFPSIPHPTPGLGLILGATLFAVVLLVGLMRVAIVARIEGRGAETALVQNVERGLTDAEASLGDGRARLLVDARAATDAPGLASAVALRDTSTTLRFLQDERRGAGTPELAVVDNTGRLLAAAPATNLPLGSVAPVRQALTGRAGVGALDSGGAIVLVAAAPVLQDRATVGAMVVVGRLDDAALNAATRNSGLSALVLSQGQLVAATTALRNRYNAARDKTIRLTPPASADGLGSLVLGGATYDVASQTLTAGLDPGRDLTLVVGRPTGDPSLPSRRLDLAGVLGAALLSGLVGWLLGRRIGRGVLALAGGTPVAGALLGSEVRAVAARLADERAAARGHEKRADDESTRLRAILDAVGEGIIVSDPERRVVLTNPAARALLGLNGGGEPGSVIPFLPPAEAAAEIRANQRVLRSYSAPIVPTGSEANRLAGVVTVLHDATAERESERLRGELLSTVSHELQTPLTAITGAADLLLDEPGGLTVEQTRFLTAIRRNANRLVALVSDLLDVSRLEAGRVELDLQPLDLMTIARSTVRTMGSLFEAKDQTVSIDVDGDVSPVMGDRRRLEQVLANLLGNASQYTQTGGKVAVGLHRSGSEVVLTVTDDGPGINAADLPNVFDKFYRGSSAASRRERGSGLGLAIVRSIVELHGGRAWVESGGTSGPERGTRFSVALPIAPEEE